jgi:hypothetical protein
MESDSATEDENTPDVKVAELRWHGKRFGIYNMNTLGMSTSELRFVY